MRNKFICGDSLRELKQIPGGYVDLTVTSPPYDNLRTYNGYEWDFEGIANELYRVTKDGGVVVWVVGDATIDGSETLTSFKQAIYFNEIGFNVHDTMIYDKGYAPFPSNIRYNQSFEYMFVLTKGKIRNVNLLREPRTTTGNRISTFRQKDGTTKREEVVLNETRVRRNIWHVDNGYMRTTKDRYAYDHPAMFPERLANDHIISWSNPGDVVLDPFGGSGTTAKMAVLNDRDFIYIDISDEYVELAKRRVNESLAEKVGES